MSYVLKSRIYREEILKWGLIVALTAWALTSTVLLASAKDETILIGVSDNESFLITESNQAHEKKELLSFIRNFVGLYYSFNEKSFDQNVSKAGDLMTDELWSIKQPELHKISTNLKSDPLTQEANLLSIDDLGEGKFEIALSLSVRRKLDVSKVGLKVNLTLDKSERSKENVWPFKVSELTDASL